MWASLGSGCEAAAAHGTKLLGLWLFPVPKAPKCLFLLKVGRFCGGIGCAWNDQKLLLLHLSLPGAPCRAALLPQDCPGRAVLGRSWKGCYRAASTSTQEWCLVQIFVHFPFVSISLSAWMTAESLPVFSCNPSSVGIWT